MFFIIQLSTAKTPLQYEDRLPGSQQNKPPPNPRHYHSRSLTRSYLVQADGEVGLYCSSYASYRSTPVGDSRGNVASFVLLLSGSCDRSSGVVSSYLDSYPYS